MGLFRQKDELFEIMSRAQGRKPGTSGGGSGSAGLSRTPSPSSSSTSFGRPRAKSGGLGRFSPISWAYGRKESVPDLIEIDGMPLVVVEDGTTMALETAEEAPPRTFTVRADTVVVGGLLALGLVFTAFFMGRTTGEPETPAEQTVASSTPTPGAENPASAATDPELAAAEQVAGQTPTTLPSGSTRPNTTLAAGFRPDGGTTTPKPAGMKRKAKKGKYSLVVCTTTPKAAKEVAKWLNTNARSPIFGRSNLEAYGTRGGSVRIRGFETRDKVVLAGVRDTNDPLGGSSKFTSAYYRKAH